MGLMTPTVAIRENLMALNHTNINEIVIEVGVTIIHTHAHAHKHAYTQHTHTNTHTQTTTREAFSPRSYRKASSISSRLRENRRGLIGSLNNEFSHFAVLLQGLHTETVLGLIVAREPMTLTPRGLEKTDQSMSNQNSNKGN